MKKHIIELVTDGERCHHMCPFLDTDPYMGATTWCNLFRDYLEGEYSYMDPYRHQDCLIKYKEE